MEYFIDIECNQYTDKLISIGIINSFGGTFYSLINPKEKIKPFITYLTGITNEMVQSAPDINDVCRDLMDYIHIFNSHDCFYCYGKADISIYKSIVAHTTNGVVAKVFNHIVTHIVDESETVVKHFNLNSEISLMKVYRYYTKDNSEQEHNALTDAKYLQIVHNSILFDKSDTSTMTNVFAEYRTNQNKYDVTPLYIYDKNNNYIDSVENINGALDWIIEHFSRSGKSHKISKKDTRRKLIICIKSNIAYFGYYWKLEKDT